MQISFFDSADEDAVVKEVEMDYVVVKVGKCAVHIHQKEDGTVNIAVPGSLRLDVNKAVIK